jgi:malonyl-CoA O-methyltransferase
MDLHTPDVLPPTIDAAAAQRWQRLAPSVSPWLHEEIGRRMQDRLQWIRQAPQSWCHWDAVRGGLQTHQLIAAQFPQAQCYVVEAEPSRLKVGQAVLGDGTWWKPSNWRKSPIHWARPSKGGVDMLWANMALHMSASPLDLMRQWHQNLNVNGYVMFSALGPDSAQELHRLYKRLGWPPPSHDLTDMHDWGDMLIQAGFAEPIMDMERIVLTYANPERLLQELAELGCNLHPLRFSGLRTPRWRERLIAQLAAIKEDEQHGDCIPLTFEIIYGHAYRPAPKIKVASQSSFTLDDMRSMLKGDKASRKP